MLLPLIRLPPLSIVVGLLRQGQLIIQLISLCPRLPDYIAVWQSTMVEYRYPASSLDFMREELSQFIYC